MNDAQNAEGVGLVQIAEAVGTPCYVYSRACIEARWRAFDSAFGNRPHLVCYAVKANSNLAVLDVLARLGAGFDIVSGGELQRVMAAGGDPARVVFSGVGKTEDEMVQALTAGIHCFNVESEPEIELLNAVAGRLGAQAPVSLRVNPDVDAATHPYIATGLSGSKFGIAMARARKVYARAKALPHLRIRGLACHIGSQITSLAPFEDALDRVLDLVAALARDGITLQQLDLGGGLGIRYDREQVASPGDYVQALLARLDAAGGPARSLRVCIEPGRAIVGNAGVLLTHVLYLKEGETRNFAIVDAAMNDLIRPALYEAWHDIALVGNARDPGMARTWDIVGPVCETGDFLGSDRTLALSPGDLLAVRSAGAYGFVMSSNYNTRPRPAEVMVDGDRFVVVRDRETVASLFEGERRMP